MRFFSSDIVNVEMEECSVGREAMRFWSLYAKEEWILVRASFS